jgi:putative ABC transport system ATP-binding protein
MHNGNAKVQAGDVLVSTVGLSRSYPDGQVNALRGVSLAIHRGEYVAIMGRSGSGKSTLLNLLGGLDSPTSGEVLWEGQPLSQKHDLDQFRARKIGFIFQSFLLLPTLTAVENIQIPMFEGVLPRARWVARAEELLNIVGLGARARHLPGKLSVGERQRVAIARALANDPVALLADEPTGNLDSHTAADVLKLFDHLHRDRGLTLIVVTHSEELARQAERTIHIQDGQVIADQVNPPRPSLAHA